VPSPWKELLEVLAKGGALLFAVYWFAGQREASDWRSPALTDTLI
jgi:hypothetical protein